MHHVLHVLDAPAPNTTPQKSPATLCWPHAFPESQLKENTTFSAHDAYKRKKDSEADSTESRTESAMYSGKSRPHSHMNNRHNQNKETSVKDKDILKKDFAVWKARTEQESKEPRSKHSKCCSDS